MFYIYLQQNRYVLYIYIEQILINIFVELFNDKNREKYGYTKN